MLSDFILQSASVTYYSVVDDGWQKQEGSACFYVLPPFQIISRSSFSRYVAYYKSFQLF